MELDPASRTAKDMADARASTSFNVERVHNMLHDGSRDPTLRGRLVEILKAEPVFDKSRRPYLSRAERLQAGLAITDRLLQLVEEHEWDYMETMEALALVDEHVPLYLHQIAFQPVIQSQASDEQAEFWLERVENQAIIGCYCQTELGHGSNVQKLETTSTYIPETQEFDIHSPSISSTKWWAGGQGLFATHAVVQARLILKGEDKGPNLFIVPLRDMKTHATLPNIEMGEIGPKVHGAFAALDNGFVRFNHVRIPRENMLAKFASVSPDGVFSAPVHAKAAYSGMVFIRANMIGQNAWNFAKAATISIRYCTVRRQFADESSGGHERQVIGYSSVFRRLLPVLAQSYAFITVSKDMMRLYIDMTSRLSGGDTNLLAETHAVSSGLKSYVTTQIVEGCEVARRSMGGHGFLASAGIGRIFASELPSTTYEGDNFVLSGQVARAALKTYRSMVADPSAVDKLTPSTAYLRTLSSSFKPLKPDLSNLAYIAEVLDQRAARQVQRLDRLASKTPWSELSWDVQPVSKAVVESFIARTVIASLAEGGLLIEGLGPAEKEAINALMRFYLLDLLENARNDLLEYGLLRDIEAVRDAARVAAKAVLPHAIGLTDAFGFSDWELDSTLGRADGKVYDALLENARKGTRENLGDAATEGYVKHIKPILERGEKRIQAKL